VSQKNPKYTSMSQSKFHTNLTSFHQISIIGKTIRDRFLFMSNLAKHDFEALDILGKNYLALALDAEIHLNVEGHAYTIKEGNETTDQQ